MTEVGKKIISAGTTFTFTITILMAAYFLGGFADTNIVVAQLLVGFVFLGAIVGFFLLTSGVVWTTYLTIHDFLWKQYLLILGLKLFKEKQKVTIS